jgi:hypothetical protein
MTTLKASDFLRQVHASNTVISDPPVRVVDMDGNEFDVFGVVASSLHGGEIRICVEPATKHE